GEGAYGVKLNGEGYVYNNTVIKNTTGLRWDNSTGEFYNNISTWNAYTDYYVWQNWSGLTSSHNIASDSTGPNEDHNNLSVKFLDPLVDDYSLHPLDLVAFDQGMELSQASYPFNTDHNSLLRAGAWDIGAYTLHSGSI
ncbi:hypothetical protein, partial [Oleiphilus sp. HI0086]